MTFRPNYRKLFLFVALSVVVIFRDVFIAGLLPFVLAFVLAALIEPLIASVQRRLRLRDEQPVPERAMRSHPAWLHPDPEGHGLRHQGVRRGQRRLHRHVQLWPERRRLSERRAVRRHQRLPVRRPAAEPERPGLRGSPQAGRLRRQGMRRRL